jgi:hypothetical protein
MSLFDALHLRGCMKSVYSYEGIQRSFPRSDDCIRNMLRKGFAPDFIPKFFCVCER